MDFDVVVIGGGPGGYVAAIRASQLGLKTALVEREKMGGVCLNWGCIPTKALLQSAHLWREIQKADQFGLKVKPESIDLKEIVQHSRRVADKMASGVDFLMKKNKIQVIQGFGKLKDKHTVEVLNGNNSNKENLKSQEIQSKYIILAVGARPKPLPFLPFDGNKVLNSKDAMLQTKLPKSLAIIGAGAIGIEYADIYSSLGSKVTIIEALHNLLPNEDEEISKLLEKNFQKRGIQFYTSCKITEANVKENVELIAQNSNGETIQIQSEKVIVGIGIVPNTESLGLEEIGVKLTKGFIDCDTKNYRTTINNIYAIGDCINTPWLAHVASAEGIRAAEDISIREGNPHHIQVDFVNYNAIPGCTYCHPEVASIGYTEKEAIQEGYSIDVGRFPLNANGKAHSMLETEGMVKVIRNKENSAILGAHIIGPNATELINEYVVAIQGELRIEDVARAMHAHPTISESLMEAAEASLGHAIHI